VDFFNNSLWSVFFTEDGQFVGNVTAIKSQIRVGPPLTDDFYAPYPARPLIAMLVVEYIVNYSVAVTA